MNDTIEEIKVPEGYTLAATLFNSVLREHMTRQLFYSSIVPIFERAGKAIKKGRYLYIEASVDDWRKYATYRQMMTTTGKDGEKWIKRRPWSLEDLALAVAQETPEATPVPA